MTIKQDYINSILQSLARIALSEPTTAYLAELDNLVFKTAQVLDPEDQNIISDHNEAIKILTAFNIN